MLRGEDSSENTGIAKLQSSYSPLPLMSCLSWQPAPDVSGGTTRGITGYWDNLLAVLTLEREGADSHHSQTPSRTHCKWEKTPPQILLQPPSHLAKVVWGPSEKLKEKQHKHSLEQSKQLSLCLGYFHFIGGNISAWGCLVFFWARPFKSYICRSTFSNKPRIVIFGNSFLIFFATV